MTIHSTVRYNRDLGEFELRCEACAAHDVAAYWPLTFEFWNPPRSMTKCRACYAAADRARKRRRYATDSEYRARQRANVRRAQEGSKEARRIKDAMRRAEILADPVSAAEFRAKSRAKQRAYLERQRERAA